MPGDEAMFCALEDIHDSIAPTETARVTADDMPPEASELMKPEAVMLAEANLCGAAIPSGIIMDGGAGLFAVVEVIGNNGRKIGILS